MRKSFIRRSNNGKTTPNGAYCGGQATVEYAVVSGVMAAVVVIMGLLLTTFNQYGQRLFELIASDYP